MIMKRFSMINNDKGPDTQPLRVIDSEEIVDVRFSDATRMPMPERSYAQEQLDIPIPLENRIAHLIPYIEPISELLGAHAIGRRIGAEVSWVKRTAERIGIKPIVSDDSVTSVYPVLTLELLEEEWQWYQAYETLDDRLSTYAISMFLAKSKKWVTYRANELGIFPKHERAVTGHMAYTYPKTIIPQLRHLILITPPEEDGYTDGELSRLTGQDEKWIQSRLFEAGILATQRQAYGSGRIFRFYPNESLAHIKALAAERKPAGEWLTAKAMALRLRRSEGWVKRRLGDYVHLAELRQDDTGKSVLHYPPIVFEALKSDSEVGADLPRSDTRLALTALAASINKKPSWVQNRLRFVDASTDERLNSNNQAYNYYDESLGATLLALPEDILDIERKEASQLRMITVVNEKLGSIVATPKNIRALRKDDKAVPLPQTITHNFGSFEEFNVRRGVDSTRISDGL
jgi:hypothetical protein